MNPSAMLRLVKTAQEPLVDTKSATAWLATLAREDTLVAQARIAREVRALAQPSSRRAPAELEALFQVDGNIGSVRETLVTQYIDHASHSPEVEERLWRALLDLAQAFEVAYAGFLREIRRRARDPRWQAHLAELVARYLDQLAFDARIRMFRYEPWIPGKWRELHDLFSLACAGKIARQRVTLEPAREPTTIERKYIALLLLHVGNAGNLKPVHVEWLWRQLGDWCTPLKLKITTRSPTALYLDLRESKGLSRRDNAAAAGEVLFLDTRPLAALLRHYIMAVEEKIRSHPLSGNTPRRVERLAVLTKVAAQVEGNFAPIARRGERSAATGEVDVIVGLSSISRFLDERGRGRVDEVDTLSTFSGTLELAIFGRLRNDEAIRAQAAQRRLARFATPGGRWEVKDVSATGLRLVAPLSAAHSITLGTLAALHDPRHTVWTLGIVRRIRRLSIERAEIGVQRIADALSVLELVAESVPAPAGGGSESVAKRTFDTLFLALDAPGRRGAVQSLVIARPDFEASRGLRLRATGRDSAVRLGRTIEEQPEWIWIAVEPMATAATSPSAPAVSGS